MEIRLLAIKNPSRFDALASASEARPETKQKVVACATSPLIHSFPSSATLGFFVDILIGSSKVI